LTAVFKDLDSILETLGLNKEKLNQQVLYKYKAVANKRVALIDFKTSDMNITVTLPENRIYNERFPIKLLDNDSIDGIENLYYGKCGYIIDINSPYPLRNKFSYQEVIEGKTEELEESQRYTEDDDGNKIPDNPRHGISESEQYYKDGLTYCVNCKNYHSFHPVSNLFE